MASPYKETNPYKKIQGPSTSQPQNNQESPYVNVPKPYQDIQPVSSAPNLITPKKRSGGNSSNPIQQNSNPYSKVSSSSGVKDVSAEQKSNIPLDMKPISSSIVSAETSKSQRQKLNQAYIQSNAQQRNINPSETLASSPIVKQDVFKFVTDNRGTYTKDNTQRSDFNQAKQNIQDRFNSAQNTVIVDGKEQSKPAGYYVGGVYQGVKLVGSAGKGFEQGLIKGETDVVVQIANVPLNVIGKDIGGQGNILTNTANSMTEIVTKPKESYQGLRNAFRSNAPGFVGEQVGGGAVLTVAPSVIKGAYVGTKAGLRNYVNYNKPAGLGDNPLSRLETTGKSFSPGDLDVKPNVQTTLTGEPVNSNLVLKKSPLGLDETPFYSGEQIRINLEAGRIVKGTNFVFDDVARVEQPAGTFSKVERVFGDKDVDVFVVPRSETLFGERFVGERTRTDFLPRAKKSQVSTVLPDGVVVREYTKPLSDITVKQPDYISVDVKPLEVQTTFPKERDLIKDLGLKRMDKDLPLKNVKGKEIKGTIDVNNVLGSNIGLFTEGQKIFNTIKAEFNVKQRTNFLDAPATSPNNIMNRLKPLPYVNVKNRYASLGTNLLEGESVSPDVITAQEVMNVQDQTPIQNQEIIILPEVSPVVLPLTESKSRSSSSSDVGLIEEQKQDVAVDFKIDQVAQSKSIFDAPKNNSSRNKNPFRQKNAKVNYNMKLKPVATNLTGKARGSYVAEVKKKGKFVGVGIFGTPEQAFGKAKFDVSNTASASLRVRQIGGGVVTPRGFLGKQFTMSKNSPGVLVERRGQRIKSAGEIQEISMKGVMFNRIKSSGKKSKSIFGGRL